MVPKRGLRPWVLLFFPIFIVKRKSLKHKGKQHLFFGNLSFGVNNGKSELPMTLKNGRKW
jgi:hypothetical protein